MNWRNCKRWSPLLIILCLAGASACVRRETIETSDSYPSNSELKPTTLPTEATSPPSPSPTEESQAATRTPGALDELTLAEALGVQSISQSHLAVGGSTVKEAGANFIHFGLEWLQLAPTNIDPADYNWSIYDPSFDLASTLGFEVMVTLGHNPMWAASFRRGPIDCVPMARFTDYVTAVVTRYSAYPYNVKFWALYNEPDVVSFTRAEGSPLDCSGDLEAPAFGDHPAEYVTTLAAAFNAIKSVDPDAVVLVGGIAYDNFDYEGGFTNEDFLEQILAEGAGDYFDAMNFHYYPEYDWRWEGRTALPGLIGKTQVIRELMATHGIDKPIVVSELGDSSGHPNDPFNRTADTQAIAVIQLFTQALAAGNKYAIWYNMNDYANDPVFGEHGLLDYPTYDPKPSLEALLTLATYLPGHNFIRTLSSTEMGATNLEGYLFLEISNDNHLYILWSRDGSVQTITLPNGVSSVVDKFGDPVTHGSSLVIDNQPAFIICDSKRSCLPLVSN